jgi:UDP:flavonoid glycosyltransferase YjiC (YdhE family)
LLTSEYFHFPITKPENLSYAGPQVDDPVWSKDWTPAWTPSDRAKVLVSLGFTFQNQTEIYLRIIAALKVLSLDAIVTLGDVPELPESLYTQANEQILVVSSAPHNVVLKYVDLVISNGGHDTVLRTLSAGVPLICMPLGRDQKDNAQRVKALGVGRMLDPSALSLKIQSAVSELLGDPHYQIQTECLAEKIGIEVKAGIAVRELESLIETDQSL